LPGIDSLVSLIWGHTVGRTRRVIGHTDRLEDQVIPVRRIFIPVNTACWNLQARYRKSRCKRPRLQGTQGPILLVAMRGWGSFDPRHKEPVMPTRGRPRRLCNLDYLRTLIRVRFERATGPGTSFGSPTCSGAWRPIASGLGHTSGCRLPSQSPLSL
jgi:hypothetical protein